MMGQRVMLLGHAVHAVVPARGCGANRAFAGAFDLAEGGIRLLKARRIG